MDETAGNAFAGMFSRVIFRSQIDLETRQNAKVKVHQKGKELTEQGGQSVTFLLSGSASFWKKVYIIHGCFYRRLYALLTSHLPEMFLRPSR